jgi:hypothetical protein
MKQLIMAISGRRHTNYSYSPRCEQQLRSRTYQQILYPSFYTIVLPSQDPNCVVQKYTRNALIPRIRTDKYYS